MSRLSTFSGNLTDFDPAETYGPITRTYFPDATSPDYYTLKARQGAAFLTADDIRVVRSVPEGEELNLREGDLQEVRFDGSEVGEIVMRGNIVMKGYFGDALATSKAFAGGYGYLTAFGFASTDFDIETVCSTREIWPFDTQTERLLSKVGLNSTQSSKTF